MRTLVGLVGLLIIAAVADGCSSPKSSNGDISGDGRLDFRNDRVEDCAADLLTDLAVEDGINHETSADADSGEPDRKGDLALDGSAIDITDASLDAVEDIVADATHDAADPDSLSDSASDSNPDSEVDLLDDTHPDSGLDYEPADSDDLSDWFDDTSTGDTIYDSTPDVQQDTDTDQPDVCKPACKGKQCGPDGCGGICGKCKGAYDQCFDGLCICVPSCDGKECGDNGCGSSCGTCADEKDDCVNGLCVCQPACGNKVCGDDGCGGSCGKCPDEHACKAGVCIFQPSCGNGVCDVNPVEDCSICPEDCGCGCGEVCADGMCKFIMCDGKDCGEDLCGGTCGECAEGFACQVGTCIYQPWCGNGKCEPNSMEDCSSCPADCPCYDGEVCYFGTCCVPECKGKLCGDNGCGGKCGTCPGGDEWCVNGVCICEPSCTGKVCGDNGCGGSCGTCKPWDKCSLGKCESNWGAKWIAIPGGSFQMGCSPNDAACQGYEVPAHPVTVAPFELLETEITETQYQAVIGSIPSCKKTCGNNCPVENVNWGEAKAFCEAVGARLPTEAEWEYAARAWTTTKYYCGDDDSCLVNVAWYYPSSFGYKHAVKTKAPNNFGLYDMLGNVGEFVDDWFHGSYVGAPNVGYPGWNTPVGEYRVYRGGSFDLDFLFNTPRVSARGATMPTTKACHIGFRCARYPTP